MQAQSTQPRAVKLSPMNRVLMHAAYQRERQNVRDAVLMQEARAISSRMLINGQVHSYATDAARKRIVRAQRADMTAQRSLQRHPKRNYFRDLPDSRLASMSRSMYGPARHTGHRMSLRIMCHTSAEQ